MSKWMYKAEFLYLTTTGWKSGQPHEIEIWYVAHEGCYYLCAGGREASHWVQNIQRESRVRFWVEGKQYDGRGLVVEDEAVVTRVRALFDSKYRWSDGLLVQLCATG